VPAILGSFSHFCLATNFVVYCQPFLSFMSVILLRHHLFTFCYAFDSYIFLCQPFYCVIHFTVCGALFFCKKFMLFESSISVCHFMLSQSFSSCMLVILFCVSHSMIYQPFFVLLQPFLCYVSHFILYKSFYLFCLSYFTCAIYFRFL
jgi:hypothetical protein